MKIAVNFLLVLLISAGFSSCKKESDTSESNPTTITFIVEGSYNFRHLNPDCIIVTSDGGYIMSVLTHDATINIVKFDKDLSVEWNREFGNDITKISGIIENENKYIIQCTQYLNIVPSQSCAKLIGVALTGDILWEKPYGIFDGNSVSQGISNDYNACYWTFVRFDDAPNFPRIMAIKHNASADEISSFIFLAGVSMDEIYDVSQYDYNTIYVEHGIFLEKMDTTGHRIWGKPLLDDIPTNLVVLENGSVITTGLKKQNSDTVVYISGFDKTGLNFFSSVDDYGVGDTVRSFCPIQGGGFYLTGKITDNSAGSVPFVSKLSWKGTLQGKTFFTDLTGNQSTPIRIFQKEGEYVYFGYCGDYCGKSGIIIRKGQL